MKPIDKRKAELREYIEDNKADIELTAFSYDKNICNINIQVAEQLLECIEALEKSNDTLDQCALIGCQIADDRKFENEKILNKIAGKK